MHKIVFTEKIYSYQIDLVGHVSNIVYIQWLENGRVRMLEELGMPISQISKKEGVLPILTETRIKYKKPLFIENSVKIEMWLSKLNNASAILEFRMYNEKGELCASAQQKGLFIDTRNNRPARITAAQREMFEKILITDN